MLKGPDRDDVIKLHAEINQIVNQRFTVTTFSITIFAALGAVMVDIAGTSQTVGHSPFLVDILLSVLLLVMCIWSHLLAKTLRTFTSYLAITGKSNWEQDWAEFRRAGPHIGYTKTQGLIFLSLNVLGFILAVFIQSGRAHPATFRVTAAIILVATEGWMFLIAFPDPSFEGFFLGEATIVERWRKLNEP
jgi:hypothetical protein